MSMVLQNTAYHLSIKANNGQILHGQRVYLTQGVTRRGTKFYNDMRWFAYVYVNQGRSKQTFPGIPSECMSKKELLAAIMKHPQFTEARKELS